MFKKPLGLLGVFLIVVGLGYFVGGIYAYTQIQGGYDSLQAFSEAQGVELSYSEDGEFMDRGSVETGQEIMTFLTEDWNFPVVESDLDPGDPLINTASEYMLQMAVINFHILHGDQTVVLTADDIAAGIESEKLAADGTYNGVVAEYQGQVLEPGAYTVPVDGRYWTGFNRTDILDGPARSQAWSGTAHGLVGELGVGAVTHSTLQLGLGIVGLLMGLGVVCTAMGTGFIWHTRSNLVPKTVPEKMVKELDDDIDDKEMATV
jgi:hypothetical protein